MTSISFANASDCDALTDDQRLVCDFTQTLAHRSVNLNKYSQCDDLSSDKETYFIFDGGGFFSNKILNLEIAKADLFNNYNIYQKELLRPIFKSYQDVAFEAKKSGSYTVRFLIENNFIKNMSQIIYPTRILMLLKLAYIKIS